MRHSRYGMRRRSLAGYVHNNSTTRLHVNLPRPGPLPGNVEFNTEIETELDGFVGGVGVTLAGGIGQFYGVLDCNYVQSDLGFDNAFTALIVGARAGWNGKLAALPTQLTPAVQSLKHTCARHHDCCPLH